MKFIFQENSYPIPCDWKWESCSRENSYPIFYDKKLQFFFSQENSYPRFYNWKLHFFSQEKSYPIFYYKNDKSFSPGEVVPKIWWVQILQENSYPNIDEYDFSWRSRTRVRFLQENSYPGTTSPGELVTGYDISRRTRTQFFGYDFSWVRLLLGTISPDTKTPMWDITLKSSS